MPHTIEAIILSARTPEEAIAAIIADPTEEASKKRQLISTLFDESYNSKKVAVAEILIGRARKAEGVGCTLIDASALETLVPTTEDFDGLEQGASIRALREQILLISRLLNCGIDCDLVYRSLVANPKFNLAQANNKFENKELNDLYIKLLSKIYALYKASKHPSALLPITRTPSPAYIERMLKLQCWPYVNLLLDFYADGKLTENQMKEIFSAELMSKIDYRSALYDNEGGLQALYRLLKEVNLSPEAIAVLGNTKLDSAARSARTFSAVIFHYMQGMVMSPEERIALYEPLLDEGNTSALAKLLHVPQHEDVLGTGISLLATMKNEIEACAGKVRVKIAFKQLAVYGCGLTKQQIANLAQEEIVVIEGGRPSTISLKKAMLLYIYITKMYETGDCMRLFCRISKKEEDASLLTQFFWSTPSSPSSSLFKATAMPEEVKAMETMANNYFREEGLKAMGPRIGFGSALPFQ